MSLSIGNIFSQKNIELALRLVALLIVLWIVTIAIPGLFVSLFDTFLGNLLLIAVIFMAFMYNKNLAVGLAVIFIILWRFSHMSIREGYLLL